MRTAALSTTPPEDVTARYAAVSGDANPIHTDAEFARSVGLPGAVLHGLYTMALVARASAQIADDDPARLRSLSVEFRGLALPGEEIRVRGEVGERRGRRTIVELEAVQSERRIVRNAVAEIE